MDIILYFSLNDNKYIFFKDMALLKCGKIEDNKITVFGDDDSLIIKKVINSLKKENIDHDFLNENNFQVINDFEFNELDESYGVTIPLSNEKENLFISNCSIVKNDERFLNKKYVYNDENFEESRKELYKIESNEENKYEDNKDKDKIEEQEKNIDDTIIREYYKEEQKNEKENLSEYTTEELNEIKNMIKEKTDSLMKKLDENEEQEEQKENLEEYKEEIENEEQEEQKENLEEYKEEIGNEEIEEQKENLEEYKEKIEETQEYIDDTIIREYYKEEQKNEKEDLSEYTTKELNEIKNIIKEKTDSLMKNLDENEEIEEQEENVEVHTTRELNKTKEKNDVLDECKKNEDIQETKKDLDCTKHIICHDKSVEKSKIDTISDSRVDRKINYKKAIIFLSILFVFLGVVVFIIFKNIKMNNLLEQYRYINKYNVSVKNINVKNVIEPNFYDSFVDFYIPNNNFELLRSDSEFTNNYKNEFSSITISKIVNNLTVDDFYNSLLVKDNTLKEVLIDNNINNKYLLMYNWLINYNTKNNIKDGYAYNLAIDNFDDISDRYIVFNGKKEGYAKITDTSVTIVLLGNNSIEIIYNGLMSDEEIINLVSSMKYKNND